MDMDEARAFVRDNHRAVLATVKDTCCGCRRVIYPGDFIVILPDARVCHVPRCGTAVAVSVPLDVEDEQA